MQTLQKANLQVASSNDVMTFVSNDNISSIPNERYVCQCSAE